nr:polyubiquitin [Tanacetum cinerariifolium]
MRKSCGLVPIFIINLDGNERYGKRRWPVNVKLSDTVSDLKARISYLTYPHDPKELVIVFNNIVLHDHCILADLHITWDSVLTLMHKSKSKTTEIFVKILAGKTISLDVIATTTIGQVKSATDDQEYIPEDDQVLIFNEMVLDDSSIIFDFGIKKGSTLTLMRVSKGLMQIVVNTDNGMSRSFEVKPLDSIGNLKNQISDKLGIPIDKQVLIFNKMVLHDSGTLADFDIKRESTLTLTRKSTGLMQIFVNTVTGMSTSIEVKPRIPGTLADFHIKTESTLTLMRKSRASMQIFVQPPGGSKFSLEINPLHTIDNLKAMVSEKQGIPTPDLRLFSFDGRRLEDSHTYADYNIQNDDVIHVVLNLGPWSYICQTYTGKTFSLQVKGSDTIISVKFKIGNKIYIPHDELILINEMVLEDLITLADYRVKKDSTLTLMRKSRGSMQIFVQSQCGSKISLEVNPLYTIANLKARLMEEGFRPEYDQLFFEGTRLMDSLTYADYNILKDVVIDHMYDLKGEGE